MNRLAELKSWHDRRCPAVFTYLPETGCECGGSARHYERHWRAATRHERCWCGKDYTR